MTAARQQASPRSGGRGAVPEVAKQAAAGSRRGTSAGVRPSAVPATVRQVLALPGRSLDPAAREAMEARLGEDFSAVRVHDDAEATASADDIGARAYTFGNHVVSGPDGFSTASSEGTALLAHELTHVVQQAGASIGVPQRISDPRGSAEVQARTGRRPSSVQCAPVDTIHRQAKAAAGPNDLTGTTYASFDPTLQAALAGKFPKGSHATLADALNDLSNEMVAILARIGSRIGEYDPGIWDFVTSIPTSGWITDNWGMTIKVDVKGMIAHLSGSPKWCKDDPDSAKKWHNTTECWREISGGKPGLHVPVRADGTSDIHVDYHQPAEMGSGGNCRFWTSPLALAGHGMDVFGKGGARTTGVARYGSLRSQLDTAASKGVSAEDIAKAKSLLDSIESKVRDYAAQGKLQGSDFAGDTAMQNDDATMRVLNQADNLLNPAPPPGLAGGF
jgi:Domain of unknown function (DUF4157)